MDYLIYWEYTQEVSFWLICNATRYDANVLCTKVLVHLAHVLRHYSAFSLRVVDSILVIGIDYKTRRTEFYITFLLIWFIELTYLKYSYEILIVICSFIISLLLVKNHRNVSFCQFRSFIHHSFERLRGFNGRWFFFFDLQYDRGIVPIRMIIYFQIAENFSIYTYVLYNVLAYMAFREDYGIECY